MRKRFATIAAVAAAAVAFGSLAGPAAADDPNVTYSHGGTLGGSTTLSCKTQFKRGVLNQYGAWGYYIDGCTVRLDCPVRTTYALSYCIVNSETPIDTQVHRGDRVTMNARIRRFTSAGQNYAWSDRSCDALDSCTTTDSTYVWPGESASVQCNGVREARPFDGNAAQDFCRVELKYR